MPIPLVCPACSRSYQVREQFANRTIQCKSCGEPMTVPPTTSGDLNEAGADTQDAPGDDWARAFGNSSAARKAGSRRASLTGRSSRPANRDDDGDLDDSAIPRGDRKVRSLRGKSGTSPVVWVLVGLSILASAGALGIGLWFGMQRRAQTAPSPGPGGFPGQFPGNNQVPGQFPMPPGQPPIPPGPIGPNLKSDPRQPGGFPVSPNAPGR